MPNTSYDFVVPDEALPLSALQNKCLSEIRAVYARRVKVKKKVTCSEDIYKYCKVFFEQINLYEEFKAIYLDSSLNIIGIYHHSRGGIGATYVDNRLLFSTALTSGASSMVIMHNHPSGRLRPSLQDLKLTKAIAAGCNTIGIKLADHIILTESSYYSFLDNGDL